MLLELECDKKEDGEGSDASIKSFAIKTSISEIVSLGEGGEKTVCQREGRRREDEVPKRTQK